MFEKKIVEEPKMVKEKRKEKPEKEKKSGSVGFTVKALVIPFLFAAIASCLIYLVVQNTTKHEVIKESVVCAKVNIDANTYISAAMVNDYFEIKEVEASVLPGNIYKSFDELPVNFYVEADIFAKQMLFSNDISEKDEVLDKYKNGSQLTSISVDAFANSVSGTLRHGDIVDVYAVDPSSDELVLLVKEVYVAAAFDNSGNELTEQYEAENGVGNAVVFSVKVAPDEIEAMNTAISFKGIQLYLTQG